MSTPHELTPDREQVLKEKLSEKELHQLLERLQAHDQNEQGMPTIGAVAEATGADAMLIHKLLREVRNQPPEVFQPMVHEEVATQKSTNQKAVVALVIGAIVAMLIAMFLLTSVVSFQAPVNSPTPTRTEQPMKASGAAPEAPIPDGATR
jgi:hypothetical protein